MEKGRNMASNAMASVDAPFASSDLLAILTAQRHAMLDDPYPSLKSRIDRLNRAITMLVTARSRIVRALDEDFGGRPEAISLIADVLTPLTALKDAKKKLSRWMRPERRAPERPLALLGVRAWVEYQPLGVVGIVAPWNAPVALSLTPLAGVLAAGNRAMIKPSELAPAVAALLSELVADAFDPTEIAVVTGNIDLSKAFVGLPFDHLLYTGGGTVARQVMRAAAANLTPVTLELGGKSPAIVGADANIIDAASKIIGGKLSNGGQICMCPDHAWVPIDQMATFIAEADRAARRMFPTLAGNPDVTATFGARGKARLQAALQEARDAGAKVIAMYDVDKMPSDFVGPTLVIDAPDHIALNREEVFGPILPVRSYGGLTDLIDRLNCGPVPLALYYFGSKPADIRLIRHRARAGGVTIGDVMLHPFMQDLPFGGLGESGMGRYIGRDGFRTFSHHKAMVRRGWLDIGRFIQPPYSPAMVNALRFMTRR
jgi:coniferyl-aldehyde dehydrogenase